MAERTTKELRRALASTLDPVLEREAAAAGGHLSPDELSRYHGGELPEADEERVQRHLTACPECLEDLLDLDRFVAAGRGGTGAASGAAKTGAEESRESAGSGSSRRVALVAAASVLVAISALALWALRERYASHELGRELAALSAPRPDVPIVDLLPDSSVRGGPDRRAPVELPDVAEDFTLVLNLPQASGVDEFRAELIDPAGRVSWRGALERSRYGTFTLGVPRRYLAPGVNRIRLYRVAGGERRLLETYTFRLQARNGER